MFLGCRKFRLSNVWNFIHYLYKSSETIQGLEIIELTEEDMSMIYYFLSLLMLAEMQEGLIICLENIVLNHK